MNAAYKAPLALTSGMGLKRLMKRLRQSPLEDSFVQNPYALYTDVLERGEPVVFWEDYAKPAVFAAQPIHRLLRDRRLGRAVPPAARQAAPAHLKDFAALEKVSLLELEPPAHTRLRSLVLRAFTSRRVKALEPDIHAICDDLLEGLPEASFDVLDAFCTALPVRVIARLLGVPEDMAPALLNWSNAMVAMYQAGRTRETEIEANRCAAEFTAFLSDYIEARRADPRDDLITELIASETEGGRLSREELIGTCVLLLNAGHEATVHTLGNAVKVLLEHRTPPAALASDRITDTVEEILRFDPPLHVFNRFAYEDITIANRKLRKGTEIMLVLGAAGRDPALVPDPDRFDPFRTPVNHAAFGGGLHFCVGAPLARMELRIGLQRLFGAFPTLQLAERPRYAASYHFHGLESLKVATV